MSRSKSILFIMAGIGFLAVAFMNQQFYWSKGWFTGDKPAPRWTGRLGFGLVGTAFFLFGLAHLLAE